jgi:hypothetical protein
MRTAHRISRRGLLSYDPGGVHTDQLRDLSLALATAELLNRTLILPRLVWHRDSNVNTSEKQRLQLSNAPGALGALGARTGAHIRRCWTTSLCCCAHTRCRSAPTTALRLTAAC